MISNVRLELKLSQVFDPVITQVLQLMKSHIARDRHQIDPSTLVGEFSGSEYLFQRLDVSCILSECVTLAQKIRQGHFSSSIRLIARPLGADIGCHKIRTRGIPIIAEYHVSFFKLYPSRDPLNHEQ